jgi:hypothetical protein
MDSIHNSHYFAMTSIFAGARIAQASELLLQLTQCFITEKHQRTPDVFPI